MPRKALGSMSREELEEEVLRLRGKGRFNGLDTLRKLAIFDSALDFAMVVTDSDGTITDWNLGAERILGWTAEEMRGQDASRIFTPEDRAQGRVAVEMQMALQDGRAADVRWHLRRGDLRFWASGEMTPLMGERNEHIGFVKIFRDRTAEHLAMMALRQREKYRKALLELSDQLTTIEDVSVLTDVACSILGRTLEINLAGYGLVDAHAETITIEKDWTTKSTRSIAGTLYFRNFGSYIENLKRGEIVVVNSVFEDPRTQMSAQAMEGINVRALVNMPVVESGRLVALLFVCSEKPHDWSEAEINFIREVASRTRTATARRSAEQALRLNERRLAALTQASSEVRFRTSPDWQELYELWGGDLLVSTSQPDGSWLEAYIPAGSQAAVVAEVDRAIHTRTPYVLEHRIKRLDGSIGWAVARAVPVFDEAGRIIEWYGAAADITDRREAEIALNQLNATLEHQIQVRTAERNRIWQVSRDMLLVSDLAGVLLAVNPAWTTCLGWADSELIGKTSEWLEPPEDQHRTRSEIAQIARGIPSLSFENRFRTRTGQYRDLAWTAVASDNKIYAVARDVTDERAQAAALEATQEALRQSQKMEAVGQLTGGLAHDFNNLLAGISGSLELLNIRIGQGRLKDLGRYISAAQGAAQRAAALTHRLLAFSRRQTLAPKAIDVADLIDGLVDLIRRTVGPEVAIKTTAHAQLWPIRVDPPQLENALLNLCINARDAMPVGGTVSIDAVNVRLGDLEVDQLNIPAGDYVALSVRDTGSGMGPAVIAKAFEPFFTTKPLGKGTGLGLSMIYGFVTQSGGQVQIHSEEGKGTTISLYLPRYRGELKQPSETPTLSRASTAIAGETVLVIDDEPTVRLLVTEVLEDLGYTAIECAEGVSGLHVLQSDAHIDLLITDVGLPGGLNGRQVADAARITRPRLKVLFITGYADTQVLNDGDIPAGMQVLTKPFSFGILASRIREMIETAS